MPDIKTLVQRTLAGDEAAWKALQTELAPVIEQIARRHPAMRRRGLATLPDDIAEIRTASLERLAHSEFQNLKRFLERSESADEERASDFDSWIYGTVDFAIREHLRRRYGRAPQRVEGDDAPRPPSKRDLQTHAGRIDDEHDGARGLLASVGMTAKLTVAQIFEFIDREFEADEAQALRLYYAQDRSFDEIAAQLGLDDAKSAERLIRRLNGRLRYHFQG